MESHNNLKNSTRSMVEVRQGLFHGQGLRSTKSTGASQLWGVNALQQSRWKIHALTERLSKENRQFGCRLSQVKSKMDTCKPWVPPNQSIEQKSFEETVSQYVPSMPSPRLGHRSAQTLLQPIIYFDLMVRESNLLLGRLSLQLYTEISPEVVLEFVRMATHNDVPSHRVLRIFPDLWMEGEIIPETRASLKCHHSEKQTVMDPSKLTGIVSYSWDYRRRFPDGILTYTISFKPLAVVPLQRVVFGRVCGGFRVLQNCREFGTKNGKTKKSVYVSRCGLL